MRIYKVKTIRALERGLEVLGFLQSSRAASLHDLHRSTGLDKATLTRIIATLEKQGLIWQRLADGAFLPSQIVQEREPRLRDEDRLVEIASPIMEKLCKKVDWPSILAVPRLDHMEVLETNSPKSYFHHIPLGPIGFRVNILRSATGRAYITFCSESERQATLARLMESSEPGNFLSRSPAAVERLLTETRELGYGVRFPDYGGDYNDSRGAVDDGRNSIAVPIFVGDDVIAALNLTWISKVTTVDKVVKTSLSCLQDAASQISQRLVSH
ncbi:MAG: helix-turn-helix domain-containing protein [Pseudomonadota bacterium]